jgi:hypothetical protein
LFSFEIPFANTNSIEKPPVACRVLKSKYGCGNIFVQLSLLLLIEALEEEHQLNWFIIF